MTGHLMEYYEMYVCNSVGIRAKEFELSNEQLKSLLTLDEYELIARKLIGKYANNFGSGLCKIILNNDDAISWITFCVMLADIRWNEQKSPKHIYRLKAAIWGIKRWKSNIIGECKKGEVSLTSKNDNEEIPVVSYGKEPIEELIYSEQCAVNPDIYKMMLKSNLSEVQRLVLICRFWGNLSLDTIASHCGVGKEAIRQIESNAITRLRKNACHL